MIKCLYGNTDALFPFNISFEWIEDQSEDPALEMIFASLNGSCGFKVLIKTILFSHEKLNVFLVG